MERAKLNTSLYQKMYEEQERYKSELLGMRPEMILEHAYEYVMREDILLAMEYNDLEPRYARALLRSETPLADVFMKWESRQNNYMDHVWDTVVSASNDAFRTNRIKTRNESR